MSRSPRLSLRLRRSLCWMCVLLCSSASSVLFSLRRPPLCLLSGCGVCLLLSLSPSSSSASSVPSRVIILLLIHVELLLSPPPPYPPTPSLFSPPLLSGAYQPPGSRRNIVVGRVSMFVPQHTAPSLARRRLPRHRLHQHHTPRRQETAHLPRRLYSGLTCLLLCTWRVGCQSLGVGVLGDLDPPVPATCTPRTDEISTHQISAHQSQRISLSASVSTRVRCRSTWPNVERVDHVWLHFAHGVAHTHT